MQLDDLKNTWEEEMKMKNKLANFDHIRRNVNNFDRRANISWKLELLTCIAVIAAVILIWLVRMPTEKLSLMYHIGMLAMVVSCAFVAAKIIWNRRILTTDDWTLSSKLNIQIEKREKETKLLKTVAYWYLTPLLIAVFLSSYGGHVQRTGSYIPDVGLWIYWTVCLVLYIGIYFFNQYRIKTKIQPILDQLYLLRRELES